MMERKGMAVMENGLQHTHTYYNEISIAKGIGILLVVLGHSLKQIEMTGFAVTALIQLIYSFHMPLFFVLSGFVSIRLLDDSKGRDYAGYIRARAVRLLIPYFTVGILYMPLKYFLSRFARKPYDFHSAWKIVLGENPNTTMWFLFVLFWVSVLALFVVKRASLLPVLCISAALSAASFCFSWEIKTPRYLFFFIMGLYLREHYESFLAAGKNIWFVLLMVILFSGCNVGLFFGAAPAGWMTAVTGSILCILLSVWVDSKQSALRSGLKELGDSSMDVYILSDPVQTVLRLALWNILHAPEGLVIIVCFVLGVGGSFIAAKYILRRFKIFRILLFGEH